MSDVKYHIEDKEWRMNNLYWIIDKNGDRVKFKMNTEQRKLYDELHFKNVTCKARQLGMTTFACLYYLDECLFHPHVEAGIIAHTKPDAMDIFRRKIQFPYDNLPADLKDEVSLITDSKSQMGFSNGSVINVGTSMRGSTLQYLLCCVSGDTEIILKGSDIKAIKDVQAGDQVMTSKGSLQKVVGISKRKLTEVGEPLLSVKTFGNYDPLKITANHKVLTREKSTGYHVWKRAGEIEKGDYMAFPICPVSMKLRRKQVAWGKPKWVFKNGKRQPNEGVYVEPTWDLGWICGFYLAEGTIRQPKDGREPTAVTFSVDQDEVDMLLEKLELFRKRMGQPGHSDAPLFKVRDMADSRTFCVDVNSKIFTAFIKQNFGDSHNKVLPDLVWGWGHPFCKGLIKGYVDGDGCDTNPRRISVVSTRRQLIYQLKRLLLAYRIGMPSIYHAKAGRRYGRNCQEQWTLQLSGVANWKFREKFGMPMPPLPNTWAGRWRIKHGRRPEGRKLWRRGKHVYWTRVTNVSKVEPEEYVYDLALADSPHDYLTVNGIIHNSEIGKISKMAPEKAREILTGALQAVGKGGLVIFESTAEGRSGVFFDMCQKGQKLIESRSPLTEMDFKLHFFPWFDSLEYSLDAPVPITKPMVEYFEKIESEIRKTRPGFRFTIGQKAWYIKKRELLGDDIFREYPATIDEAFRSGIEGTYFKSQFRWLRENNRITSVPVQDGACVDTWWDLGMNDLMSIWFTQDIGREVHVINYYENSGEGLEFYRDVLDQYGRDLGYRYGRCVAPHDIKVRELGTGVSRLETARSLGLNMEVAPLVESKMDAIQKARSVFKICWFDLENTAEGLEHLEEYRKQWDEIHGVFKDKPLHDQHSHGADSFLTFAIGHDFQMVTTTSRRKVRARRVIARNSKGWT